MIKTDLVSFQNKVVGSVELPKSVFAQPVNESLVLQVIKAQLAGQRQGTASSKTKSEIRGGGKKPFKQKGTGNARQGSIRSPLQPGGGSNFGPKNRSFQQKTPKKMIAGALRSVLSDKLGAKRLVIIDELKLDQHKTKALSERLSKDFKVENAVLLDINNKNLDLASRNLPKVAYLAVEKVNVYDLVKYEWLFCSKQALEKLCGRLG